MRANERFQPPDTSEIEQIAEVYGFDLTDRELDFYQRKLTALMESYRRVDDLFAARFDRPAVPVVGARPPVEQNDLGAWAWRAERRDRADGPLSGHRIAVKDIISVAEMPMTVGSAIFEDFVPTTDAEVVRRLLEAGATIVGKTTCESLCFSSGSHTAVSGVVRNPHDRARSAGGSSSGSAVVVAIGEADGALGTDTGGSVRTPASYCGIYGLKPTFGLVPTQGVLPLGPTLDHVGPMAASVAELDALLMALTGGPAEGQQRAHPRKRVQDAPERSLGGLRIGVLEEGFGWPNSEPEVDETVCAASQKLAAGGAEIVSVSLPLHRNGVDIWVPLGMQGALEQLIRGSGSGPSAAQAVDVATVEAFARGFHKHAPTLSPSAKEMTLAGELATRRLGGVAYAEAKMLGLTLMRGYDELFSRVDLLVLPTNPMKPSPLPADSDDLEEVHRRSTEPILNTCAFNVTGHPAISIPCGCVDGLPIGLMAVGPSLREDVLIDFARACELLMPPPKPHPAPSNEFVPGESL
jgi:amidase